MMNELVSTFKSLIDESHYSTLNEFKRLHPYYFNEDEVSYWLQHATKVPSLFSLAFNKIEEYNIFRYQLPPVLRDLSYVKAVFIHKNTIYYYTSFALDINCDMKYQNPFACDITGINYVGHGPYRGTIPDGVEYVHIQCSHILVLPKSVKYLSLCCMRSRLHINMPLLYLRLDWMLNDVYIKHPIKILVVTETERYVYCSLIRYADYLIYQPAKYFAFEGTLTPQMLHVTFAYSERQYYPRKITVCSHAHDATIPHITVESLLLYFSKRIQFILKELMKSRRQRVPIDEI